jgi:hypothetical protein
VLYYPFFKAWERILIAKEVAEGQVQETKEREMVAMQGGTR